MADNDREDHGDASVSGEGFGHVSSRDELVQRRADDPIVDEVAQNALCIERCASLLAPDASHAVEGHELKHEGEGKGEERHQHAIVGECVSTLDEFEGPEGRRRGGHCVQTFDESRHLFFVASNFRGDDEWF